MDFKLPENTTMIADTARRYLKDNYSFDTYIAQLDESNHLDEGRWQAMTDLGWFGLPFAESVGGYGGTLLDVSAIVQEMGAALCLDPYVDLIVSPGKLLEHVNTSTSLSLLEKVIAGDARVACGFYDRHAGYNILKPSLRLNSGRLSGQKHIVSDGGCADTGLLSSMSGDELVIIVLPIEACDVERYRLLDGSRAASLTLDDVEISEEMICVVERTLSRLFLLGTIISVRWIVHACMGLLVRYFSQRWNMLKHGSNLALPLAVSR
jgi:alkylation response protein AidB-like acyl-CoA dehydrogenase